MVPSIASSCKPILLIFNREHLVAFTRASRVQIWGKSDQNCDLESVGLEKMQNVRHDVIKFEMSKTAKKVIGKYLSDHLWRVSSKSVHPFRLKRWHTCTHAYAYRQTQWVLLQHIQSKWLYKKECTTTKLQQIGRLKQKVCTAEYSHCKLRKQNQSALEQLNERFQVSSYVPLKRCCVR